MCSCTERCPSEPRGRGCSYSRKRGVREIGGRRSIPVLISLTNKPGCALQALGEQMEEGERERVVKRGLKKENQRGKGKEEEG